MNAFEAFDPLITKSTAETTVAALAQKREISNILGSYVGWYDPFCELIQNGLDSIESRAEQEGEDYIPMIHILVDIENNSIAVTDNGTGLDEDKFKQFLCPDISFKSGNTRGHKGVGATFLAYGFNFIQVATKSGDFEAIGKMENARSWLSDPNPSGNPKVKPDSEGPKDQFFDTIDQGVSVYLKFDSMTHPKDLKWIVVSDAENWFKILTVKTGLGAFIKNEAIQATVTVIDRNGLTTHYKHSGIEYFSPHLAVMKSASVEEIREKEKSLFDKMGSDFQLPAKFKNLDVIYQRWNSTDLLQMENDKRIKFSEEEKEVIKEHSPSVYVVYAYSLKVWEMINKSLNVRTGHSIIYGGIQIAANNMPQGELIQIPLKRNIGRQNQIHLLIHFDKCSPDLGRKGFQGHIVDFAKDLSRKIADGPLERVKNSLRVNTGANPNLRRETKVDEWKKSMEDHENLNPLEILNPNFFLPYKKISITSMPTREQDTIALFNQLLAGGVIRGLRVMSTNERLTYDGLIRVVIEDPTAHHLYDEKNNPLGIESSVLDEYDAPFVSPPRILEYKYSLDGLIEDIQNGDKNSNDINLVVCWETGDEYIQNYQITSLLDPDNLSLREYHGLTHVMINLNTKQREMDLIVLSELIEFLNKPQSAIEAQIKKYEY